MRNALKLPHLNDQMKRVKIAFVFEVANMVVLRHSQIKKVSVFKVTPDCPCR